MFEPHNKTQTTTSNQKGEIGRRESLKKNPEQEMENGPSGLVETELDLKHSTAIYPILDRTSSADGKLRNAEIKNKTTSKIPVFHRRNHLSHLKNQVNHNRVLVRLQRRQAALFPPMKVADAAQLAAAATLTTPARE
ncbi:hypothetical protein HUJ05_003539 [Dendroctonus ponderosae]|nr:hypothetical protein HUJ05_003539 [Dendroctonus ponderosae]